MLEFIKRSLQFRDTLDKALGCHFAVRELPWKRDWVERNRPKQTSDLADLFRAHGESLVDEDLGQLISHMLECKIIVTKLLINGGFDFRPALFLDASLQRATPRMERKAGLNLLIRQAEWGMVRAEESAERFACTGCLESRACLVVLPNRMLRERIHNPQTGSHKTVLGANKLLR